MSLQSINGAQEFADDHYTGEPEMNAESEYCRVYVSACCCSNNPNFLFATVAFCAEAQIHTIIVSATYIEL